MLWGAAGVLLVAAAAFLTWISPGFGYDVEVIDMPAAALALGLAAAGLVYAIGLPLLVRRSPGTDEGAPWSLLAVMIGAGLLARLVLIPSVPVLEDDWQRYLWDGAVTARGHNPYAVSPQTAMQSGKGTALGRLSSESGLTTLRINHRDLKTIYPPVTQGAFALAHLIRPWSLTAWKAILLVCDIATLALLLALLREAGRSPLWSALYWWNPIVLKELFNSGHMEAIVLPFVLVALLLAVRRRWLSATASVALAAGAKLWPVLLLPLLLRPLLEHRRRRLTACLALFAAMLALLALPILLGGLGPQSGFVAYAERWQTNSAHLPALQGLMAGILSTLGLDSSHAGRIVRALLAVAAGGLALAIAARPWTGSASANAKSRDTAELMQKAGLVILALLLLSPSQYPWYFIWLAPFLAFMPWPGLLLMTATLPLYYTFFHFAPRDTAAVYREVVVWLIWLPVWAALAWQWLGPRRARRDARPTV